MKELREIIFWKVRESIDTEEWKLLGKGGPDTFE